MRFGVISQWYDPEPGSAALRGVLARGLASRGHEVQVLTGFPNYPTGVIAPGYRMRRVLDETLDGVRVRRVALYPSHDASAARRAASYASFGASALVNGLSSLRGLDAVWVDYTPITVAWPMWGARLAFQVPAVIHVLDLWPDTVFAGGFAESGLGHRAAHVAMSGWCKAMYRTAESVAYIAPSVGEILQARGVPAEKLHYVPLWADESLFHPSADDLRAELDIADDAIVLLYAGALGVAQGLGALVEACAQITDPRFVCLIAGSGIAESSLRARAEEAGAANVRFLGRLPQERMTSLMATCDLSFVGLRPHALSAATMPSKTQAALASGRALLVAAEGDVTAAVDAGRAGFIADPQDPASISAAIRAACNLGRDGLSVMGAHAREYYESTFSMEQGVTRIESLLQQAAATRRNR